MDDQLTLVAALERPGFKRTRIGDPETSLEAAESVTASLRRSQQAVLAFFRRSGPMDDERLVADYVGPPPQSPSGLRTRRHELVDAGLLADTGRRVRTRAGRRAIVWGRP